MVLPLSGGTEADWSDRFFELLLSDSELLNAEFVDMINANWTLGAGGDGAQARSIRSRPTDKGLLVAAGAAGECRRLRLAPQQRSPPIVVVNQ